jgi:hypothetical protein
MDSVGELAEPPRHSNHYADGCPNDPLNGASNLPCSSFSGLQSSRGAKRVIKGVQIERLFQTWPSVRELQLIVAIF